MQTHAVAIADGLHARGHEVRVLTYRPDSEADACAVYDRTRPYPTRRVLGRLAIHASVRTVADEVDRFRPDAVVASTTFFGALVEARRVPVICRSVGNDVMRCWVPYPFRFGSGLVGGERFESVTLRLYRRLRAPTWIEDFLLARRREFVAGAARSATRVLANSDYTRDRLLECGVDPTRIRLVVGGVDSAAFAPRPGNRPRDGQAPDGPRLLTACRLVAKKGLEVLLESAAIASRDAPGLTLTVVGDGPMRAAYEAEAARVGLGGRVRFVGRVPHSKVRGYYHRADLFVLPSRPHVRKSGWTDVETMGRVLCEANAAGVPVIATWTGGVPSVIQHGANGWLVAAGDSGGLAEAIVRLWRDRSLRDALASEGLRRARSVFDWSAVLDAYERVLAEVTPPRRA